MSEENWGVGNGAKNKAFQTIKLGNEPYELFHGEHPHSRSDNSIYARGKSGDIYGFDGHRLPFKIEIELCNYLKTSGLSGNEIRKGGSVKIFLDGNQIFEAFCRSYEGGYFQAHKWIMDMEMKWAWYPYNLNEWVGKTIGYREQLFTVSRFIVDQACMILKTLDGKPRKKFLYEDEEDFEPENSVKVEITSDAITWYPGGS